MGQSAGSDARKITDFMAVQGTHFLNLTIRNDHLIRKYLDYVMKIRVEK